MPDERRVGAWAVVDWGPEQWRGFHRYAPSYLDLAPDDGIVFVVIGDWTKSRLLAIQLAAMLNNGEYKGPERRKANVE